MLHGGPGLGGGRDGKLGFVIAGQVKGFACVGLFGACLACDGDGRLAALIFRRFDRDPWAVMQSASLF